MITEELEFRNVNILRHIILVFVKMRNGCMDKTDPKRGEN